jgi:uncharacterized protein
MVGGGWVAVVLAAAACSGGAASRPVALASTPDAPRAPAAAPRPPQKPAPRPECTKTLIAAATLAEVTAIIEAERCNGHVWNGSETPLMRAAVSGATDVVAYLIEAGAPVDFAIPEGKGRSETGKTALWFAVTGAHPSVVKLLLDAGADPNQFPPEGLPLLVLAAMHDDIETARLLVAAGIDVNQASRKGATVMTYENGPGALVFAFLVQRGMPTTGLTQQQVESLMWEASHQPTSGATTADRVAFLVEILRRTRSARSREAAIKALGALGAESRAAVPALIEVTLAPALDLHDWSAVYAPQALQAIGWSPELDTALPKLLAAIPKAPSQARISLVELVATKAPSSNAVLAMLQRLLDKGPDQRLGARALAMYFARGDVKITPAQRRTTIAALRRASKSPTYDINNAAKRTLEQIEAAGPRG